MVVRTWMRKRHEIATTTAAAFRGYVGRMGIRLKKKLKRQRAAKRKRMMNKLLTTLVKERPET